MKGTASGRKSGRQFVLFWDAALARTGAEELEWTELLAGEKALALTGELLPKTTLDDLAGAEVAIKGPLGTPVGGDSAV